MDRTATLLTAFALVSILTSASLLAPSLGRPGSLSTPPLPGIAASPSALLAGPSGTSATDHPRAANFTSVSATYHFLPIGGGTNETSFIQYAGPLPVNITVNISIQGFAARYVWSMGWGDGTTNASTFTWTSDNSISILLTHEYLLPAIYTVSLQVDYYSTSGGGGLGGSGPAVQLYGPGGMNELTVNASALTGPPSLPESYTAKLLSAPAFAYANWSLNYSDGESVSYSQSGWNLTTSDWNLSLAVPGWVRVSLSIYYPNGLLWDIAQAPLVSVDASARLYPSHTTPTGPSPWNLTFWANVTNISGAPYVGNGTIEWAFDSVFPWSWVGQSGPDTGSPVWHEFYLNSSGALVDFPLVVRLVSWNGTILGWNWTPLELTTNPGGPNGDTLTLAPSTTSGPPPLLINVTARFNGTTPIGGLFLQLQANGPIGTPTFVNVTNWSGAASIVPITLTSPGAYYIFGNVYSMNGSQWLAGGNFTAFVALPGTWPSVGLAVTMSGSPPLNASAYVTAAGGLAPYDLNVCASIGAACTPIYNLSGWNGSYVVVSVPIATGGNYTVVATVTDSAGQNASRTVVVSVPPPPGGAPLAVQASFGVSAGTSDPGKVAFTSEITGGVGPLQIQWNFGDGQVSSALPGTSAITHTYARTGSYDAILTVTDALGHLARAQVGPVTVSVPTSAVPSGSNLPLEAGAGAAILIALLTLAALSGWAWRRGEARQWRRELEGSRPPVRSESGTQTK